MIDPILDELTVVESSICSVPSQISEFASVLAGLDSLGFNRLLCIAEGVKDRLLAENKTFWTWCFSKEVDEDCRRLVVSRIDRGRIIDGDEGRIVLQLKLDQFEGKVDGQNVVGATYSALSSGPLVGFVCDEGDYIIERNVYVTTLVAESLKEYNVAISSHVSSSAISDFEHQFAVLISGSIESGKTILARSSELFPNLLFQPDAEKQIEILNGKEEYFSEVVRHLRELQRAAKDWSPGAEYSPRLNYSKESDVTLSHSRYGKLRKFKRHDGRKVKMSLHSKIGPQAWRVYFEPVQNGTEISVLIGYVGKHLPSVSHAN